MMAVLVLLALLSAVVLPNFERWFNNTEERAKAAELATILQKVCRAENRQKNRFSVTVLSETLTILSDSALFGLNTVFFDFSVEGS